MLGVVKITSSPNQCCLAPHSDVNLHFSVDYPVQVFFALVETSRHGLNTTEKLWMPFHAFFGSFGCFFSLAVFDFRL